MTSILHEEVQMVAHALYGTRNSLSDAMIRTGSGADIKDMMYRLSDHATRCWDCNTWLPPGGIVDGSCHQCRGGKDAE